MAMPPGFGERMQVDDGLSSSSDISSPPVSPQHNDTIRVARPNPQIYGISGGGVANGSNAHSATAAHPAHANTSAHAQNSNAPTTTTAHNITNANGAAPEKPKRQRKKKEVGPDGKAIDDGKLKEKKPRKPREPKDKTAATTASAAPRKKLKTEENKSVAHDVASSSSRQQTITAMINPTHVPSTDMPMPPKPQHSTSSESIHHSNSLGLPASGPPTPRPISSGPHYDPIRGYVPGVRNTAAEIHISNGAPTAYISPRVNRASESPSIASLIDPPVAAKTSAPAGVLSPPPPMPQPAITTDQPTRPIKQPADDWQPPPPLPPSAFIKFGQQPSLDGAMDIDLTCDAPKAVVLPAEIKAPSKSSSASAPTPKAGARPTPPPPAPKAKGSGLLSTSNLFGAPSNTEDTERKGVNIDLHIPLNPQGGNTINIAHEIFKKYGRDAINPRAAAHRERLLQIQAVANKIDGGSADDMSADLMSDIGDDSNVEMGGMDEDKNAEGADGDAKPRKRRKKVEEYDKEDDFIDDTELAWQEQAAVAKDGFFVYSGPLVPEGQAAQVESSTAPTTRGGRGRGRGRGRAAAAAAAGTTHASLAAEKSRDPGASSTRARGRGRGTGAPRKPRITKADRERMESEKADRERAAGQIGGPVALAPTPTPQPPPQSYQQQQMGTIA